MAFKSALVIGATLLFASSESFANYTETKSCDTCGYSDARKIAKQYYQIAKCEVSNLNDNNPEFGQTTYQCDKTQKDIIVANPLSRMAYKFVVTAEQVSEFSTALNINTEDTALSHAESEALQDFYEIDHEFREAVKNAGTIVTSLTSANQLYGDNIKLANSAQNSASSEECNSHPSAYLTSEDNRRKIEKEMSDKIATRLGDDSWHDYFSNTVITGGGLQVGKDGFGVSVALSHNKMHAYAIRSYGDPSNALVFKAEYKGESVTNGKRKLYMDFLLERGASRVDGIVIGTFMSGTHVNLKDTLVSNCLIQNLESIDGAVIEISGDGGSGSSDINGGGFGNTIIGGSSCTKEVKYTTCSTFRGVRQCTENSVTTRC